MSDGLEQTLTSIQHYAISEVLHLLDGFYENLEHGLFELAYHRNDQMVQGRCALAMKNLRLQKAKMIRKFTKLMQEDHSTLGDAAPRWPGPGGSAPDGPFSGIETRESLPHGSVLHDAMHCAGDRQRRCGS